MKYVIAVVGRPEEQYPWYKGERLLHFGEIENMPGHCVVMRSSGNKEILDGYHDDNFIDYNAEVHEDHMRNMPDHEPNNCWIVDLEKINNK